MDLALTLRTGSSTVLVRTPPRPRGRLVMAHGAGNDRTYSFEPFFAEATRHGLQVLSLDLPGHGRGNSSQLAIDHAVEDFAEAVHAARHAVPGDDLPWVLLGNSLGGALSLRALAEGRVQPKGVIGVGVPSRLELGWAMTLAELPSLFSAAMRSYRPYVRTWTEVLPAFGAFRREDFPVRCDVEPYLAGVQALINRPWGALAPEARVYLVQGARDAVARARDSRAWARQLAARGALVDLEVIAGIGHLDVMLHARVHRAVLARIDAWIGTGSVETTIGGETPHR